MYQDTTERTIVQHNKNQLTRTDKMGEWISVEDKMPPPMTLVLALVQYDSTPIIAERRSFKGGPEMWWATCPEYGEINGDAFWYGGFEGVGTMVTHWMPLPEPPSE